jgi:Ca2+-binding RTX toxin-like protein
VRTPPPRTRARIDERRRLGLRIGGILGTAAALAAIGSFMADAKIWPFDERSSPSAITSTTPAPTASQAGTSASTSPTPTLTPATVQVPNVIGELAEAALEMLILEGLEGAIVEEESTLAQPGTVYDQQPDAGGTAVAGDVVTLYVARPFCDGEPATLIAYGGETTAGTGGDDVILAAGEGRAEINAGDGDDRVCLGAVRGIVDAGAGNDRVRASPQDDIVEGGDGDDYVDGGAGNDWVYGEDSTATTADRGDDRLLGGEGNDLLHGDRGNDIINGGPGRDTLFGGPGDDVFEDIDPDLDGGRAGEELGDDDFCPGVGNVIGPFLECESW